ncbi:MAG: hypothetical protein HYZ15_08350 [Sphingobacteriales bacterium]|nr:hypothetical protein [Sphingobacteriales bacterium]
MSFIRLVADSGIAARFPAWSAGEKPWYRGLPYRLPGRKTGPFSPPDHYLCSICLQRTDVKKGLWKQKKQ